MKPASQTRPDQTRPAYLTCLHDLPTCTYLPRLTCLPSFFHLHAGCSFDRSLERDCRSVCPCCSPTSNPSSRRPPLFRTSSLPLPILPKHLRLTARSANLIDSRLRSLSLQHNRAPSTDMFPDLSGSSTPPFHNSNLRRRRQARQDVTFHYNGLFDCPFSGFGDVDGTLDLSMHRPRLPSSGFHAIRVRRSEHR